MIAKDLVDFLVACLDEDEALLQLPEAETVRNSEGEVSARGYDWVNRGECPICGQSQFDGSPSVTADAWYQHAEDAHQRTKALRDIEFKRALLELHDGLNARWVGFPRADKSEYYCNEDHRSAPCVTVRLLADVYRDHPDFDPTWEIP